MIRVESKGSFVNTDRFLNRMRKGEVFAHLNRYGQKGAEALAKATPKREGETAAGWDYRVTKKRGRYTITWTNSHIVDNVQIAVIIQYGHATRNGGWVEGVDYINPVIRPLFDEIASDIWKEVQR